MTPQPNSKGRQKLRTPETKKIALSMENLPIIQDLSRALGLVQAVQDTTKGERRATVLQDAIDLISRHLP